MPSTAILKTPNLTTSSQQTYLDICQESNSSHYSKQTPVHSLFSIVIQLFPHLKFRSYQMMSKFSYRRLRHEADEEDGGSRRFDEHDYQEAIDKAIEHVRARTRWTSSSYTTKLKRVHIKKRLKIKIPNLRKFLRRKARVVVYSLAKVVKRLKESQAHFGDLFAGNYLFMQVAPTPMKYVGGDNKCVIKGNLGHFPSRYSLPG